LAKQRDGTIIAFCRDSGPPPGRVMASLSRDNGETWSAARDTDIPNPGSSLEVIVLRDGRWLIVYNDSTKSRDNLTIAISEDEGKTWPLKRRLEPQSDGPTSFSYPSVIQSADGAVHITYTCVGPRGGRIRHGILQPDQFKTN
jgi:predicted neuraminidase